ncbi:MAG: NADP-dependent malic enzyme [Bacteroidales bacterium]|nr:NADP-dependent malic enzyme [Bacteroidales bacterium]
MIKEDLSNLAECFPKEFGLAQKEKCKTLFYKKLSILAHEFYHGKMQTFPKVPLPAFNWFNVWYTPGVSGVSTSIRDNNPLSYSLSNRSNLVAVVSDSTRVLGDGDCTPPGGLGVMEGKAFLMKYLGGVDAVALCMDSRDENGVHSAQKIIDFVKMVQPSFGAINLEDISHPNCYRVLDELRASCEIPVWHDDAQGTACITLAGVTNALKLAGKKLSDCKIVLYGVGAANTSIARLMIADGADPKKMVLFSSKGSLHDGREDYRTNPAFYRQWELCKITNPTHILTEEEAFRGADLVVAASRPDPTTLHPEWIASMAEKAIVFACANPVPEIYPEAAKEAGAFIVATGRGDYPNQVNNSVCFPAILKGTLSVHSKGISDSMAIAAAHSIAAYAEQRGISVNNIIPNMMETDMFPKVAADVAMQACLEGLARITLNWDEVYAMTRDDIAQTRQMMELLTREQIIPQVNPQWLQEAMDWAVQQVREA